MNFEKKESQQEDNFTNQNTSNQKQDLEKVMNTVYIVAKWDGSFYERKDEVDAIVNNFLGKKENDK